MMFSDAELISVLEHDMPDRFGGGPTDYELAEEEGPDGSPRLRLLVHSALGHLDGTAVAQAFLEALGSATRAARVMSLAWRDAGFLQVERRVPGITASGKILHFRQARGLRTDAAHAGR